MSDPSDLAVYIHWPYCARICPYCDFNVYKGRENPDLVQSILADLTYWREWSGPRNITSIHFGGGTPSLLPAEDVERLISHVGNLWNLDPSLEIALEANPNDSAVAKWRDLNNAGVKRLSLGVQTFSDDGLSLLGRDHNGDMARRALDTAMDIFPSVSLDLIFGWHGQTKQLWQDDMLEAISRDIPHISAYQLTIEDGTAFAKAESRGQRKAVDEDMSADFYDLTRDTLLGARYDHYEVSNYAKPGHTSQHNLTYWTGGDYVGVGPGAHGRLTVEGQRFETIAAMTPRAYSENLATKTHGMTDKSALSSKDWAREHVLMGLRISEGISLSRFKLISGQDISKTTINDLSKSGLLIHSDDRLVATSQGRLLLNRITQALLEDL